ncbi:MAG: SMP-30/gluconolactonase/LRE family protein [Nevskiales bacterium]
MIRSICGLAAGVVLASLSWLAACSGSDAADPGAATVDPSTLCVASACGTKTRLIEIPNAENTLFTPQGRLFVSGGSNVYEVSKDTAGFHAAPLYDGSCNFTGLAQRGEVLYAACFDLNLYAANLTDAAPKLQAIYSLAGMAVPNGMTSGPDGELYIADGPLSTSHLPSPKIVQLQFDAADPMKVTQQLTWLSKGVGFPNGLSRRDRILYFTDTSILPPSLGEIRSVEILPDGSAGTPQVLTTILASLPDDVSVVGDDLLLALYSEGAIALVGADGKIVSRTAPLSFQLPSSVKVGRPPLFEPTDLVVTEKGVVGVSLTGPLFGNALSVYRPNR